MAEALRKLPLELRQIVYRYVISDHVETLNTRSELPWDALSCFVSRGDDDPPPVGYPHECDHLPVISDHPQLYPPLLDLDQACEDEAAPILFSEFEFYFTHFDIIKELPQEQRIWIKRMALRVSTASTSAKSWHKTLNQNLHNIRQMLPRLESLKLLTELSSHFASHSNHQGLVHNLRDHLAPLQGIDVTLRVRVQNDTNATSRFGRIFERALYSGMKIDQGDLHQRPCCLEWTQDW